jgi:hypothetical protein
MITAIGTRVGSVPLTISGAKILASATTSQIVPIENVNPAHGSGSSPLVRTRPAMST